MHILNNGCKITGNPTDIKQWTTDGISEKKKIIEVKQSVFFTFFFFLLESDSNAHRKAEGVPIVKGITGNPVGLERRGI